MAPAPRPVHVDRQASGSYSPVHGIDVVEGRATRRVVDVGLKFG
jgi:hypothetical protein